MSSLSMVIESVLEFGSVLHMHSINIQIAASFFARFEKILTVMKKKTLIFCCLNNMMPNLSVNQSERKTQQDWDPKIWSSHLGVLEAVQVGRAASVSHDF